MDLKSKILVALIALSVFVSVFLIYQRMIVRQDFEVLRPENGIPEGIPGSEEEATEESAEDVSE